jgi:hypothetical protein
LIEEQIAAEAAAAAKQAEKEAKAAAASELKAAKAAERAAKKEATEAAKADKKAAVEAEKAAKLQAVEDAKADKKAAKAAKAQAKIDAKAAKDAQRQPEQNGVRRPGPDGLCGKVWGLADSLSAEMGQAVPIANLVKAGEEQGLNASNIRTEYARWKKFHGLSGRIVAPAAAE